MLLYLHIALLRDSLRTCRHIFFILSVFKYFKHLDMLNYTNDNQEIISAFDYVQSAIMKLYYTFFILVCWKLAM